VKILLFPLTTFLLILLYTIPFNLSVYVYAKLVSVQRLIVKISNQNYIIYLVYTVYSTFKVFIFMQISKS